MITILARSPSPKLIELLRSRNDDDEHPLNVVVNGRVVTITRQDGSQPSETERAHIMGTLAANRVMPIS